MTVSIHYVLSDCCLCFIRLPLTIFTSKFRFDGKVNLLSHKFNWTNHYAILHMTRQRCSRDICKSNHVLVRNRVSVNKHCEWIRITTEKLLMKRVMCLYITCNISIVQIVVPINHKGCKIYPCILMACQKTGVNLISHLHNSWSEMH